ncbi:unnamed protein product, partial [Coregonus sp. 'balchen']
MYQNSTVMVQRRLPHPKEDSRNQKGQAETKKDKGSTLTSPLTSGTPTAGAQVQTHTTGLSSPLPAYDHQSQDHTTISLLRDRLALLEVWVTELKEQPPCYTTSSPDTELLQDQINQCRTQLKNSVQELRESLTTALEEVKATMRRELVWVNEEMAKELPNAPHRPNPPPEHHHFHWPSQTGPGPAYYPAPDHHLYQTREEAPRSRPGPPPLHRAQQQDQRTYAE